MTTTKYDEITFSDSDVVNPEDFVPSGEVNVHGVHPFLFHDHGFVLAVVFASDLQDALDIAADDDRLDRYFVGDVTDYGPEGEGLDYLGLGGNPYDIEGMGVVELPNPPFSFVALFRAAQEA